MRGERQVRGNNYSITEFNGYNTQTLIFDKQKHWSLNCKKIIYPHTDCVIKEKGKNMSRIIKVSYALLSKTILTYLAVFINHDFMAFPQDTKFQMSIKSQKIIFPQSH